MRGVPEALRAAGFPIVKTKLGDAPNVVIMEKARGLSYRDLSPAQREEADALALDLAVRAGPILSRLYGKEIDGDIGADNMFYELVDGKVRVTDIVELGY